MLKSVKCAWYGKCAFNWIRHCCGIPLNVAFFLLKIDYTAEILRIWQDCGSLMHADSFKYRILVKYYIVVSIPHSSYIRIFQTKIYFRMPIRLQCAFLAVGIA